MRTRKIVILLAALIQFAIDASSQLDSAHVTYYEITVFAQKWNLLIAKITIIFLHPRIFHQNIQ